MYGDEKPMLFGGFTTNNGTPAKARYWNVRNNSTYGEHYGVIKSWAVSDSKHIDAWLDIGCQHGKCGGGRI